MSEDAGKLPKPNAIDYGALFERVHQNRLKLDACPRHLFPAAVPGIDGGVAAMLGRKIKCEKCGGEMDLTALNYYVRGYEAAGRDGNDILPGWKEKPGNGRTFFKPPEDA